MAILLNNHGYGNEDWKAEISKLLPDQEIFEYPHIPDKSQIDYALVWDHPKGDLNSYPNLKAIFSLGAGVEHLVADEGLRDDIPIVRLIDPAVAEDMAVHSLYWCIHYHRHYGSYMQQQSMRSWRRHDSLPMSEFQVGILGLGNIGTVVATKIVETGYSVSGWDLSFKDVKNVTSYVGDQELSEFLSHCHVVVNCLPLTASTMGLIDDAFLRKMNKGSFFINISRGAIVDENALIIALDDQHIENAALDAFSVEPLPDDHPYWTHPKINITPHVSGATYARSAAKVVVANINCVEIGEAPYPLFDRIKGY